MVFAIYVDLPNTKCGLAFLSSLYHICEGFYEDSGMHAEITGDTDLESWLKIEKE